MQARNGVRARGVAGVILFTLVFLPLPTRALFDELTFVEFEKDGVGGVDGLDAGQNVVVSPDGKHVYATGSFDSAVAAFSRNADTGALTFVEFERDGVGGVDGLNGAWGVTISPEGTHVYVAGVLDDAVAIFSRDASTGALGFVGTIQGVPGLDGADGVVVSPDGAYVYVTGAIGDAVVVFSRNPTTGGLTHVETETDGTAGVDGLDGAFSAAVSPDGKHLYVASSEDGALAVFARDQTTGALTFVESEKDGQGGIETLREARGVALSPDGNHVYVTGAEDSAITVFFRDATTGALFFVEAEQDGVAGVEGLAFASDVVLPEDGFRVYVSGVDDGAVNVFSRSPSTGALAFVEMERDGVSGVDGLQGANGLALSPLGDHLYVVSLVEDSVAAFARQTPTCRGKAATILGDPDRDVVSGTPQRDVIAALGGRDKVFGGGGNDLVCGGKGNDILKGGRGKDTLLGESQRDLLVGGPGDGDVCKGGKGNDRVKTCERGRA